MRREMNIFLIEDNDLDVEILQRGLKKAGVAYTMTHAKDGVEALEILNRDSNCDTPTHPYFILLDINMPRMNGHEFLAKLRASEDLRESCVFVFTTSENPADISLSYKHNANGYIVKPENSGELNDVLQMLSKFWDICKLPKGRPSHSGFIVA